MNYGLASYTQASLFYGLLLPLKTISTSFQVEFDGLSSASVDTGTSIRRLRTEVAKTLLFLEKRLLLWLEGSSNLWLR
jgi:hypothetical protein